MHHKSLILQHKNPKKKKADKKLRLDTITNQNYVTHYLKKHIEGGVGGAGQAMAQSVHGFLIRTVNLLFFSFLTLHVSVP